VAVLEALPRRIASSVWKHSLVVYKLNEYIQTERIYINLTYHYMKLFHSHFPTPVTMAHEIVAPERRASEFKGGGTTSQV
jgi:hypothetical protein